MNDSVDYVDYFITLIAVDYFNAVFCVKETQLQRLLELMDKKNHIIYSDSYNFSHLFGR